MRAVEPEQVWKKLRRPGVSGFMRLRNGAEFLDRAIASDVRALDGLAIVFDDCIDETRGSFRRWEQRYPDKITVAEYEPKVIRIGTLESLTIDPRSPHCIANYYNFAPARTNRMIVIEIDGDHLAVSQWFRFRIVLTGRGRMIEAAWRSMFMSVLSGGTQSRHSVIRRYLQ
ncbi:MAG: hypothetical protein M0002_19890 [Rhodospirillales bacterium]|nr:hypothetical protein [Rhodospirillales bacterium]